MLRLFKWIGRALKKTAWRTELRAEKAVLRTEKAAAKTIRTMDTLVIKVEDSVISKVKAFLKLEAAGGIVLMFAALAAIIVANTPLFGPYAFFLDDVKFHIGFSDRQAFIDFGIEKSVRLWINDGLMALFFFLIGLEIKYEFIKGELSSRTRLLLPALGAIGGIAAPALIFWYINADTPAHMHGWAIPTATDIAFALGVISLLGSRVPTSLKVLLTAIAVLDDIAAILIIAMFYTADIDFMPLYFAGAALIGLALLSAKRVVSLIPYVLLSLILWITVLESGIHATIAGVIAAFFIPMENPRNPEDLPLERMENALHPWVAFGVLPLFAFANAGVPLVAVGLGDLMNELSLGIILGLVLGKPTGVFLCISLAIASRISPRPQGTTWLQLFALSCLCGIGFTMSLFIGSLAFDDLEKMASIRLGVLVASVLAACVGFVLLKIAGAQYKSVVEEEHPTTS